LSNQNPKGLGLCTRTVLYPVWQKLSYLRLAI